MPLLDPGTCPDGSGVKFCSGMVVSDSKLVVSDPRPRPLGPLGTRDQGPGTRGHAAMSPEMYYPVWFQVTPSRKD